MSDNLSLENQIRRAFSCTLPLNTLSEAEYEDLNSGINRFDDPSVKKYLPLLLIKDMTVQGEFTSGTGDHLIYFLDGALINDKKFALTEEERLSIECSSEITERTFKSFTIEQAKAILRWLKEFAYFKYEDFCGEELESAISYWQSKVDNNGEPRPNS